MLAQFYEHVGGYRGGRWVHWNMNSALYGFPAIAQRALALGVAPVEVAARNGINLATVLKRTLGDAYAPHPRLESLIRMNGVSNHGWLDPARWAAEASSTFNKASKRVVRAIRWLRKMHTEDDMLDRFLAGWTGLETLNPELCKHFGVEPSGDDIRECGKCGEKLVRKVPRANGLKELFIWEGQQEAYDACSKARNGLPAGLAVDGDLHQPGGLAGSRHPPAEPFGERLGVELGERPAKGAGSTCRPARRARSCCST